MVGLKLHSGLSPAARSATASETGLLTPSHTLLMIGAQRLFEALDLHTPIINKVCGTVWLGPRRQFCPGYTAAMPPEDPEARPVRAAPPLSAAVREALAQVIAARRDVRPSSSPIRCLRSSWAACWRPRT